MAEKNVVDIMFERIRRFLRDLKNRRWKPNALAHILDNMRAHEKIVRAGNTAGLKEYYSFCHFALEYYKEHPSKENWQALRARIFQAHAELKLASYGRDPDKAAKFLETAQDVYVILTEMDALKK